ncbi:testis-specific serine/threonine-protein kinase 4-like [Patella vulgata]|uniref:testis-specific serine/threonine-protein kinase 4-like n=1 Tax=Patella vulgata TaxID=6465 RepID=UPI00217F5DDD|nr:testis-specific serine/threonine-protein kinase 4-like [Patella vulgata]
MSHGDETPETQGVRLPAIQIATIPEVKTPDVKPTPSGGRLEGASSSFIYRGNKRYQILESQGFVVGKTLGQGSYATVKAAYDVNRKHKVAVKVISKKKAPEDYLTKFLPREIEIVRILRHPALVTFYQVIETTSRFFLVMEIADNGDLLEAIRTQKQIPENQAGLWFKSLHDGILYMHGRGIVHRDLKCENLLIDTTNTLRITDFGFSRRNLRGKLGEIIYSETYCGSYAYAPPEILKGIPYNPFLAEVWSMGVVLFTMVYGRLPFDDSDHKRLLKQTQARVVFPAKSDVSEECRILILKMLIKGQDRVPVHNIEHDNWFKKVCLQTADKIVGEITVKVPTAEKIDINNQSSGKAGDQGMFLGVDEPGQIARTSTAKTVIPQNDDF